MVEYKCMLCGWTFDSEPGMTLEDLPDDWTCPLCGAGKDMFQAVE